MDYVNRKRPQPKKGAGKGKGKRGAAAKANTQKAAKPVPWLIVILALVLIGGFAYLLYQINGKGEEKAAAQKLDTSKQAIDQLPELPEERWQYIEELENKEVQVDVPELQAGPPKLMQCGSFRSQSDAESLRARIAMVGLESQVRASEGSNGRWYRVILGPYETKRAAERDRHKLQRSQVFGCAIWNWNLD